MTPKEIAAKILETAESNARFPELFKDEILKEITRAIEEERGIIAKYLQYLNQAIATKPELVRHRLLMGSSRIASGTFVEDVSENAPKEWLLQLSPLRKYYARSSK